MTIVKDFLLFFFLFLGCVACVVHLARSVKKHRRRRKYYVLGLVVFSLLALTLAVFMVQVLVTGESIGLSETIPTEVY